MPYIPWLAPNISPNTKCTLHMSCLTSCHPLLKLTKLKGFFPLWKLFGIYHASLTQHTICYIFATLPPCNKYLLNIYIRVEDTLISK